MLWYLVTSGVSEDAQERCCVARDWRAESEALGSQLGETARPCGLERAALH
jgi:hypothetical protein